MLQSGCYNNTGENCQANPALKEGFFLELAES